MSRQHQQHQHSMLGKSTLLDFVLFVKGNMPQIGAKPLQMLVQGGESLWMLGNVSHVFAVVMLQLDCNFIATK